MSPGFRSLIEKDVETDVWVTRDGERIAVRDMSDSHIENAIRLLGRGKWKPRLYPQLVAERDRRASESRVRAFRDSMSDAMAACSALLPEIRKMSDAVAASLGAARPAPVRVVRLITLIDEEV